VRVPCGKELAIHAVLESCATHREARREMLTEVRVGQPLSHEMCLSGMPTLS
jgi:hypothetical protein